jgi:hypothetical protein
MTHHSSSHIDIATVHSIQQPNVMDDTVCISICGKKYTLLTHAYTTIGVVADDTPITETTVIELQDGTNDNKSSGVDVSHCDYTRARVLYGFLNGHVKHTIFPMTTILPLYSSHADRVTICQYYNHTSQVYYFDRDATLFDYVLHYCRTGQLHCPLDMCAERVCTEFMFWGVDVNCLAECCRFEDDTAVKQETHESHGYNYTQFIIFRFMFRCRSYVDCRTRNECICILQRALFALSSIIVAANRGSNVFDICMVVYAVYSWYGSIGYTITHTG